jgi:hypothetical protein
MGWGSTYSVWHLGQTFVEAPTVLEGAAAVETLDDAALLVSVLTLVLVVGLSCLAGCGSVFVAEAAGFSPEDVFGVAAGMLGVAAFVGLPETWGEEGSTGGAEVGGGLTTTAGAVLAAFNFSFLSFSFRSFSFCFSCKSSIHQQHNRCTQGSH